MAKKKTDDKNEYNPASFRELMRYAQRFDWILLTCGVILSCIHGCLPSVNMIIFRGITEVLILGQADYNNDKLDMPQFTKDMLLYIILYFIHGLVTFGIGYCSTACFFTLCERQVYMIRKNFLKTLLNQDMEWFEKNNVGKLTQKMSSQIDQIRNGTSDKIAALIQAVVSLFVGLGVAFWLSWKLSLMMIFINPFIMAIIVGSAKTTKKELKKEMDAYGEAGSVCEEVISGIKTVESCNAQETEIKRYSSHLLTGCKHGIRKAFFTALFSGLHYLLLFGSMGLIFWYGTKLTLEQGLSPGNVFAVFWAALGGAMRLGNAIPQISVVQSARLSAREIFSIIDRKPAFDCQSEQGQKPTNSDGRIEFKDLEFNYPSRPVQVLKKVSFVVEKGQTVGLVGHSGCGKSTLFTLLMRYYEHKNGTITFDNIPIDQLNTEWLRNQIGLVSQDPVIFAGSVEENLRMGNEKASMDDLVKVCEMANAHEFIRRLPDGYETKIGDGGIKLSGGQKQRLMIARALIRNPKLLLLDEATSSLDTQSEKIVQKAIEQASSGRTTIIIAHRLSTIRHVDKIFVFESGNIVEEGNHDELMEKNGLYKQLVTVQEIEKLGDEEMVIEENKGTSSVLRRKSTVSKASSKEKGYARLDEKLEDPKEGKEDKPSASLIDIYRAAQPEHKFIHFGLLATVVRGVVWPIFSIIYGQLFLALTDALSHPKTNDFSRQNMINGISFAGLGIIAATCTFLSGFLFGMTGEKLTMRLRTRVFSNILSQDGTYFDDPRHSTGKLTARLASDAPNVQVAIDQRLADVLQGMVSLITGLSVGFYFDWHMTPVAMGTAFVVVGSQLVLTAFIKRRGFKDVEIAEEASRIASESIENVKTIQALTRQNEVFERYCQASERPYKRAIQRGLMQAISFGVSSCYFSIHFALAYLFGLLFIRAGYLSPFVVFQVIEAVTMASFTVMGAANYLPEYLRARIAAGLMFKMMNEPSKIDSRSEIGAKPEIKGNVALKNLYFSYPNAPKQLVLNGLSFEGLQGKTVGIVGPSGCGKSTVVLLLERFYDCLSGNLLIDDINLRQLNIRHFRNEVALVSQEPTIFNLSIRQNIAYGLENVTEERIVEAAKMANIHDFIDSLPEKYETNVGPRGTQLSQGQKQRLTIARAMIRNPKILLLDEATSSLDTQSEKHVQDALDKAIQGKTSFIIAHRLSTIQRADLIVVMNDGRVVESGTHQELLSLQGLYYNLVQKQSA